MRHLTSILLFFCLGSTTCFSQEQQAAPYKHGISIELLGLGGWGSINYERFFNQKEKRFLAYRIGLGFAPGNVYATLRPVLGLPHGITANFGRENNFETGLYGTVLFTPDEPQSAVYIGGPMIGYRRQSEKWFFRVFIGYYYSTMPEPATGFRTNAGLAFGLPFRKPGR